MKDIGLFVIVVLFVAGIVSGCKSSVNSPYAYLMAYTNVGNNVQTNVLHLSVSLDGIDYQVLNK